MSDDHRPRRGDKFWDRNRFKDFGEQPNGTITDIEWDDGECEITVTFMDHHRTKEQYFLVDIEGCWEECFGGTWMVYPRGSKHNLPQKV